MIARLDLVFERRAGRTVVSHAYVEPPFRIGRVFDLEDAAYVILVCTGPGIFGGDALEQSVTVGAGARVVLTSQSALQVHPAANRSPARVDHRYDLDADAELHCHWDPIIPFADACIAQRFHLRMPAAARFTWSDAVMSGRVSRGETWQFRELAHELRVEIDEEVRYLERYRVRPADDGVRRTWVAGGANYLQTLLVYHVRATSESAEQLQRELERIDGVSAGVDVVEPGLLAARIAAAEGVPFARARAACRTAALDRVFRAPELAGRKSVG